MNLRNLRRAVLVAGAGLLFSACMSSPAGVQSARASRPTSASSGQHAPAWIIAAGALERLKQAGLPDTLLREDFDRPSTLLIGSPRRPDPLAPRATRVADFTSASALISALRHHALPASVPDVLLDLESWHFTPTTEQHNPTSAAEAALSAARAAHKTLIFTPALDLVHVVVGHPLHGRALFDAYDSRIATPGAKASDVFEIQAQSTEGRPSEANFAPTALRAVETAHPGEPVFVGLSTNPSGRKVTAADLLRVVRDTPGANGYWLNVPAGGAYCPKCGTPEPAVAVAFLEALAAQNLAKAAPAATGQSGLLGNEGELLAAGGKPATWVLAEAHFDQVVSPAPVRRLLGGGTVFEPVSPRQRTSDLLGAKATAVFHSEALLASAAASGAIPASTQAILYDNERFADTPADEQADPAHYDRLAAALASEHGWTSICDLVLPDRLSPADRNASAEVPPCDVVGLNTVQQSERDPERYAALVERDVALVHSVAPGRPVLAGLSANPRGGPVTAAELAADIEATHADVAGYWLNVPSPGVGCPACHAPDPAVLVQALELVARAGAS